MKGIVIAFIIIIILFCTLDNNILNHKSNNKLNDTISTNSNKYTTLSAKSKKWYQCKIDDKGTQIIKHVLNKNNITRTYDTKWDIILPCNQNYKYDDLIKINVNNSEQIISFMSNSGILGSKERLWKNLKSYYGRKKAETIMPPTYIFPQDAKLFHDKPNKSNTFVLKSERQRQGGIKITRNVDDVVNHSKLGYCLVQEYLHNSLGYLGKKINLRIYLVYVVGKNSNSTYIYDDGIVSYAKYSEGNVISFDNGVSSFYSSKDSYDKGYPITINTLKPKLPGVNWNLMFNKIKQITKDVILASKTYLGSYTHKHNNTSYQLFGMDFYIGDKYDVKLLEINIGPGMTPYNSIDKDMRTKLHENILHVIGLIDNGPNQTMIKL